MNVGKAQNQQGNDGRHKETLLVAEQLIEQ